jgi:uncharacterized protein YjbI with pentapeptide repeats
LLRVDVCRHVSVHSYLSPIYPGFLLSPQSSNALMGECLIDADLRGADLTDARVSREQLNVCKSYEGATMAGVPVHA